MSAEPIIQIHDLHAHFQTLQVLRGINLDIFPNETIVILGRSGCGKSTLLRNIVGLLRPTSGFAKVKGVDLSAAVEPPRNEVLKKLGMLFQGGALFNSMTIAENVSLPLVEHTQLEPSTIQIMARIKLELVGLSDFEHFMPSQLSGGMKKRAALARALAMDPEILCCDEPSAGLDPIVAAGIDQLLLKLKQAFRMTLIVVTHELSSVFVIADRIALLDDGEIVFSGTKEQMRTSDHPVVVQFLERRADPDVLDRERYLISIMGQNSDRPDR